MNTPELDALTAGAVADELSILANNMEALADRTLLQIRAADYRDRATKLHPDADGWWRGVGGLVVQGGVHPNGVPCVMGQWGRTGFGFSAKAMRGAASVIVAACTQADTMASKRGLSC